MNYVFYDTEGTGTHTRFDQITQFAAIVTDENFQEIETINIRSKLLPHVVPHPMALFVTGMNPYDLDDAPLDPFMFTKEMHAFMKKWAPAAYIGQNILRYDEEILRTAFYTNLLDPYPTSSQGCMRIDTVPMLRFIHTVDPDSFKVHQTEDGKISFKLDKIAPLNGFEGHHAHDALGDVRATIYMTKLLKERRPDLFNMSLANCRPNHNHELLENRVVHLMTYFGKPEVHPVTLVGRHPENSKQVVCFNLSHDPTPWLKASPEQIAQSMMKPGNITDTDELPPERPFQIISTNKQPTITKTEFSGLQVCNPIERELMVQRLEMIKNQTTFSQRIAAAMAIRSAAFSAEDDKKAVEEKIYSGFPKPADKQRQIAFHAAKTWKERATIAESLEDGRLKQIAQRLILFYAPELLPANRAKAFEKALIERRLLSESGPHTTLISAQRDTNMLPEGPEQDQIKQWLAQRIEIAKNRILELEPQRDAKER